MTSNSRQTRTAGSTDATIAVPANAKTSRALMEAWVEPPLRAPAPSFMEYPHLDIARHGVLENMAPLGTMPSSKVRKLAKTEGPRRVTLVRKGEQSLSAASTPREAVTPEPPVIPARARSESRKMEDSEWNPTTPIAQTSARKGNLRDSASLPPLASPYSTSVSPNKQERELQRTDRIVEYACREAHAAGRIHTGYALRTLYYDHRSNPRIVRLIELVALQEATEEQQNEFRSLMHYKKKEGRTGGKARQWFNSASEKSFPSTPVHFFQVNFGSSPKKAIAEAISDAASRSPHKENNNGHIHKKHKGNNYEVKRERETSCEVNGHGAMNGNHVQSRRSRSRSHSVISSGSELSSLDEELLGQDGMEAILGPSEVSANQTAASDAYTGGPKSETWGGTTDDSHAPAPENLTRPITNPTTLGPILHAWNTSVVPSASSSSTTNTNSQNKSKSPVFSFANHDPHTNNMPALLAEPFSSLTPNPFSSQQPPQHPNLKSLKKAAAGTVRALDENADRTSRLKRKAREITENHAQVLDSFERSQIKPRDPEFEAEGGDTASQRPRSGQVLRFRSSQANKKSNDESEDLSSPTLLSFQQDLAPGSSSNSRAGTPGALSRVARKQKSGLRTKTSPMKKKAGPSAGIPRASGERNSPVGNGTIPQSQDDNDDYCSSCGGNGDLVCCDGCTRSFHFRCVDPPLDDTQLPDSWFCNACFALRNPKPSNDPSLFGQLLAILRKKNPSAFHLPKEIREYFENVRTGTEGEYEEGVVQKPKRNAGYEEAPDYLKLRDAKGNFILCHECHKGAGNGSPIIPCTYCGLNWHLDCLDPPLANPPPIGRAWRCPCHVDDLLAKVPGSLGPAHRFRKIKGASVMRPAFPRGFKNDGHIEVELDPSDDEDEGFYDQKEYGKVYKLPEEGIKLDFISRIYSQVGQTAIPTPPPESMEEPVKQRFTTALRYSILEQQAALNFAQLATQEVAPDGAQLLIDTLISQASPTVVAMIAQGDASNIASNNLGQREKQSLLAMKALIEKSLEQMSGGGDATATEKEQTLKTEEAEDFEMLA